MASDFSFDVVCKVDLTEACNAVNQAVKEISQRFDFKGSKTTITLKDNEITIVSDDEFKLTATIDILKSKMVKRKISLNALDYSKVDEALGGAVRQVVTLMQGIPTEKCKEMVKDIKKLKIKAQAQIQGEQVRISSKSKDTLQEVMNFLKESQKDLPLNFENYR